VLLGQVDLVGHPVESELDGLIGWALVEVIQELDDSSLGHWVAPFRYTGQVLLDETPRCANHDANPERDK
jgi:hypothetical protein